MKLDVLVLAAHPDDAELACGGTILNLVHQNKKVGIADLTHGEMGTRGNPQLRCQEAHDSANMLGISIRLNLNMADVHFQNTLENQLSIVKVIRKYRPYIILANAVKDRHPDHGKAAKLQSNACFISGLTKIETEENGKKQGAWRPRVVYHYIQNNYIKPDFVVDVSTYWNEKMNAILAFKSQFDNIEYKLESDEPETFISSPHFLRFIQARGREYGHYIDVEFGEGFTVERAIGVKDISSLM